MRQAFRRAGEFLRCWCTSQAMTPRRAAIAAAFCLAYPLYWLVIKAGWILDGLRKLSPSDPPVIAPVFIVGSFRSGTTFLHRMLAQHPDLATMQLWEILFAPSRSGREALSPLFHAFGGLRSSGTIHSTGWLEPEEDDYLHLFSFHALTVGMSSGLTELAARHMDTTVDSSRERIDYYRRCISRFLSLQPKGKRYLSKNPALTPRMEAVAEAFPDARFVVIERDPGEVLVSLSRMMRMTWRVIGTREDTPARQRFLQELVSEFSRHPRRLAGGSLAGRIHFVPYRQLVENPQQVVAGVCAFCNLRDFEMHNLSDLQK